MSKKAIFFIIIIILVFSSISGYGGFFYGTIKTKKKAELEKEAAIKGAIYDAKETLSKEAIEKAQEVLNVNGEGEKKEEIDLIKQFYSLINEKKYDEAWELISSDYKKVLFSVNGIKKDFINLKSIDIKEIEFRSDGETTSLYSVILEKTLINGTKEEENFFVRILSDTLRDKILIDGIDLKDKEDKNL